MSESDRIKKIVVGLYKGGKQGKNAQRTEKSGSADTLVNNILTSRGAIDTVGLYQKLSEADARYIHDKKNEQEMYTNYTFLRRIAKLILDHEKDPNCYVAMTPQGRQIINRINEGEEVPANTLRKLFKPRSIFSTQERNIIRGT